MSEFFAGEVEFVISMTDIPGAVAALRAAARDGFDEGANEYLARKIVRSTRVNGPPSAASC